MMPPEIQRQLLEKDSPLSRRLRDFVRPRVEMAYRHWSQRHAAWREAEQLCRSYREPDAEDESRRQTPLTEGVRKIVVPYPYAVMQSMLAFFMTVFTQRKPIIPVESDGVGDVRAALFMELMLGYQSTHMEPTFAMALFQQLFDACRYGVGIIKNTWGVREWPDLKRTLQPIIDPFTGRQLGMRDTVSRENVTEYEGNQCYNVSPFDFLPDPRRPIADFQRGEFCGFRFRLSWTEARQREAQGVYAGIQFVPRHNHVGPFEGALGHTTQRGESDLDRIVDMAASGTEANAGEPYIDGTELYCYCDPGELGLGSFSDDDQLPPLPEPEARDVSDVPELWVFTLANGQRVVRAEPANLPGRRFPAEVCELNYDWHSPANVGIIESFKDLTYILSWLFNSRQLSVERTINNESVYDPSIVEELDILRPGPGKLIRLKEQAQQAGMLDQAVHQLDVQDVTAGHYNDARFVTDLIETVTGANRLIMGLPNTGRRSATETQGQLNLSSGRMKMLLEIVAQQSLQPLARQMSRNTQTFASDMTMRLKPPYDRLLGAPLVTITPMMIQGDFSFPFTEVGMPTDKLYESNMWKELLQTFLQAGAGQVLMSNPSFAQTLPQMLLAIFGRMLHSMGVKDLQTFGVTMPQLSISPMDAVQAQVQQGNLVPEGPPEMVGQARSDGFARPPSAASPNGNGGGFG